MTVPRVERDVAATCRRLGRQLGFEVWPLSDHRRAPTPGMPDDYWQHDGKDLRVWLQYKHPTTGRHSERQRRFQSKEVRSGGTYLLVDSVSVLWDYLKAKGFLVET